MPPVSYGAWLAGELARRGISQRYLAMRTGLNHSTICRIVRADIDPQISTAARIARVLGWPPLEVLSGLQAGGQQ
jgi:transcriptional regulator with XRE-family HTH domain